MTGLALRLPIAPASPPKETGPARGVPCHSARAAAHATSARAWPWREGAVRIAWKTSVSSRVTVSPSQRHDVVPGRSRNQCDEDVRPHDGLALVLPMDETFSAFGSRYGSRFLSTQNAASARWRETAPMALA